MKKFGSILMYVCFLISCFVTMNGFSQEYPDVYPDSQYDKNAGDNGWLRRINQNSASQVKMYSIQTPYLGHYKDLFRVTTSGVVTIANPNPSGDNVLQFFSNISKNGEINTKYNAFNFTSPKAIRFYPSGELSPLVTMDRDAFSVKTDVSISTYGASNPMLRIFAGPNGDPTISQLNQSWFRIGGKSGIAMWGDGNETVNNIPNLIVSPTTGHVGVNTINTPHEFNVFGAIYSTNVPGVNTLFGALTSLNDSWNGTKSNHGFYIFTNNKSALYIDTSQNTYIGLTRVDADNIRPELKSKYRLFVDKGILSVDYAMAPKSSWSDHVFDSDYKLKSIGELDDFISTHKHLPNVPSANQVATEGYSQHDMNKALLEKIEELTLYTIEQQNEIDTLSKLVKDLLNNK